MSFLRRQLDPHFLFNSLNSVAALIGTDASAARRMCLLLADFFRKSLKFSAQQTIALRDELTLIETFLAIEEVRFGERLRRSLDISDAALGMSIPALLLQPLVENAVHHGIAHLVAGGEISISAKVRGALLDIAVENSLRSGSPDLPQYRPGAQQCARPRRVHVRHARAHGHGKRGRQFQGTAGTPGHADGGSPCAS